MRRDAVRLVAALGSGVAPTGGHGASLEVILAPQEPARMAEATLLRDRVLRAWPVPVAGTTRFAAFLDGIQESRAVGYAAGFVPIVLASVGAAIRARVDRRMVTWGDAPRVQRIVCVPSAQLDPDLLRRIVDAGMVLVNTGSDPSDSAHPQEQLRRAVQATQRARERLERELAESWCASQPATLYLDGALQGSPAVLASGAVIGVVKSHHTLYASGAALQVVLGLAEGERSSIMVIDAGWRPPVASWYLRLRDPRGRDPLWGMVRVEAPLAMLEAAGGTPDVRADEVSGWILAERAPLALPDGRWDTLAYGIRDCEVYLRATLGLG
jgi:hypothetical protein